MKPVSLTHTFPKTASPLVLFTYIDDCKNGQHFDAVNASHGIDLAALCKSHGFTGKQKESFMHLASGKKEMVPVVLVGLGDKHKDTPERRLEHVRRAIGVAVSQLKKVKAGKTVVIMPIASDVGVAAEELFKHTAIAVHLAAYENNDFKKNNDKKKESWKPEIALYSKSKIDASCVAQGNVIGHATYFTRSLADTPPNYLTPTVFAEELKKMSKAQGLKYTVFDEEEAERKGMGCFFFVSKASYESGQFVTMEYKTTAKNAPTIALVGKGVCFDSGGISLKPANYMTGMKYDMSGAAAVAGAMQAIAQLKPEVNVVGVTPLVENMIGGGAGKQDDVITAMNGTTVEVNNTDAEGRLILADALCYAQEAFKPDVIIDVATLTGACAHALGHFYSGLMTRDNELAQELQKIGELTGDRLWPLPLDDDYKPALKSYIADTSNIGTPVYKAGAMTAALFLELFVKDTVRWAHLDIAGTDSKIPGTTYLGGGATGVAVKLFVDFAMKYKK